MKRSEYDALIRRVQELRRRLEDRRVKEFEKRVQALGPPPDPDVDPAKAAAILDEIALLEKAEAGSLSEGEGK